MVEPLTWIGVVVLAINVAQSVALAWIATRSNRVRKDDDRPS